MTSSMPMPFAKKGEPKSQSDKEQPKVNPNRKCSSCPAYAKANSPINLFGGLMNSAMCMRHGFVLGNPGMNSQQNAATEVNQANKCDNFGEKFSATKDAHGGATVVMAKTKWSEQKTGHSDVRSCRQCMFFVAPGVVQAETGWTTAACLKKKKLIPFGDIREIGANCDVSLAGPAVNDSQQWANADVELLPQFDENFVAESVFGTHDDPLNHQTVKPLTDEDKRNGIQAWGEMGDNGYVIQYPIFSPEAFTDVERAKIPRPGDPEHPESYLDHGGAAYRVLATWLGLHETPSLIGPAGVGKSELARYLAYRMQIPFERISVTESTELDDIAGKWLVSPERGTYFSHGRLPLAWQRPSVILLDEPNTGTAAVWQFLRPLTDNSKQLVLDAASGEKVIQNDYAFLVMAMNPAYDPRNTGVDVISDADGSRLYHIRMNLPDAATERKIIQAHVALDGWKITKAKLEMLMAIAEGVREILDDLSITWGLRTQIKIARALRFHPPLTAIKLATDHLHPDEQEKILAIARPKVG